MKPLNNSNFGSDTGKISIDFYDGTAVVSGWVVKQTGTFSFEVSDGATNKIVRLAKTADELTALTAGTGDAADLRDSLGTIEVTNHEGNVGNVASIYSKNLVTIDGERLKYALGVETLETGEGAIATVAAAV